MRTTSTRQENESKAQVEAILEAIAMKHLGVPTLKTRSMDSLDFHQVSVWELREALHKALMLGTQIGAGLAFEKAKGRV